MSKDLFSGLPDDLQDLLGDVEKESAIVEIKVEKRKYGKLWALVSGIDRDSDDMKALLKKIKAKLACAGTVKGKTIEVLYGKQDRSKELIDILVSEGYQREAIHVTGP